MCFKLMMALLWVTHLLRRYGRICLCVSSLIRADEGLNCNGTKFVLVSSNRYGENVAYVYTMILRGYLHLVHVYENGVVGSGVIEGCALASFYNPWEIEWILFVVILIVGEVELNHGNWRMQCLGLYYTAVLLLWRHDCVSLIVVYVYVMINQTGKAVDVPSLPPWRGLVTHCAWRIVHSLAADSQGRRCCPEHSVPLHLPESWGLFSPVNCFQGAKTLHTHTRQKYNAWLVTVT